MKSPVVKRSIVVAGHKTSVSLEEAFWNGMKEISGLRGMTLSELVGEIDGNRQQGNLSSAIRLFVLDYFRTRAVSARRIQNSRTHSCASLDHDLIRLNRIMIAFFLFEHDLRANASRLFPRENRFPLFRIMLCAYAAKACPRTYSEGG